MEIKIKDTDSLPEAASRFIKATASGRVFAFHGEMGAGKTTFISAVCRALGAEDDSGSPTFSIINEYYAPSTGETIYHFDCYRLERPEDAYEIGVEDYLYSGNRCFIEWPEVIESFLPDETVDVYLSSDPETGVRTIKFEC